MIHGIVEVMYFVSDREQAAAWYAKFFGTTLTYLDDDRVFFVRTGYQDIWFHQADEKVGSGSAGQVSYWKVNDFDTVIQRALEMEAQLYRGPLRRYEDHLWMCQLKDPFGNLIGIIGPSESHDDSSPETISHEI